MVWSLHFQLAGLVILVVVLSMNMGQKKLNFMAEKAFTRLLFGVTVCTILDIMSVFAINYREDIPEWALQFSCETYLFSIVAVAALASLFAVADVSYSFKQIWKYATAGPVVIEAVILLCFKTYVYVNEEEGALYSYGTTVTATYVLGSIFLASTIISTTMMRKKIQERRVHAIYFWMGTWILAGIIQFLNNKLLLASFAMAIACIYMYCKLENPEYHLDFTVNAFNRKGFSQLMEEYIRYRKHRHLITISINNLGAISEIFGNNTVNALVTEICDFLQEIQGTHVFRLEDKLFAVSLYRKEDVERAVDIIEDRLSRPWEINDIKVRVDTGVSYMEDVCDFKEVEELEEVIHYFAHESSKAGASPLKIDAEQLGKRKKTLETQRALEWALANNGVEMYYQPIYNIEAGKFTAMEALVRIKDEAGRLIMPVEFIEFAEKNGMILKLGEMIFRSVCEFIQRNHIEEYGIEYIEVNLSVVQCMQDDLAREFKNIMGEYQIPPHKINLEITETAAISTQESLERNMEELIKYGTSFSLDDYGSGYSNLTYIVGMPLKIIKIDRSLTIAYDTSEKAKTAIEYTVEMVHKLGMEIVVEGIETEEQYANFKKLGVEYIQGYYFSKPLPRERVLNYVQEWL